MDLSIEVKQANTLVNEIVKKNRNYYHGKNPILSYNAEHCRKKLRYLRSKLKHQELNR